MSDLTRCIICRAPDPSVTVTFSEGRVCADRTACGQRARARWNQQRADLLNPGSTDAR